MAGCAVGVPAPDAFEQCITGEGIRIKARQTAVGGKARRAGMAGARPSLMPVAVADHAQAMPLIETVRHKPFERPPGRMNFYRRLQARVVGIPDFGIASATVRENNAILFGQVPEKIPGRWRIRMDVTAVGDQGVG